MKIKKVKISGLCKDIPNVINVDVSNLDSGETLRISDISNEKLKYCILADEKTPIVEIKAARGEKSEKKE